MSEAIKPFPALLEGPGETLPGDQTVVPGGAAGSQRAKSVKFLRRVAKRFSKLLLSDSLFEMDPAVLRHQIAFYSSPALLKTPESFFRAPEDAPRVEKLLCEQREGGDVFDLSFKRSYQPINSSYTEELEAHEANNVVRARYWKHKEKSKGTLIAVHGWLLGRSRLSEATLAPEQFYEQGFDVVIYELPLHGRRASAAEGGATFPCANLSRTNEGFGQAIYELRQLRSYLLDSGVENIGVMGMSLGGYVASLWSCLDELDFVICISPLVKMAPFVKSILRKASIVSDKALAVKKAAQGTNLERVYAVHSPLRYACKVAPEKRVIVSSRHDQIVPRVHSDALCSHWGGDAMIWASGGHFNVLNKNRTVQRIIKRLFPE